MLTPLFSTCQSVGQAADEKMGRCWNKLKEGACWAFWARMGIATGKAEGRRRRDHVSKLSFRFCYSLFKQVCFLVIQVKSRHIGNEIQIQAINSRPPAFVNFDQPHPTKKHLPLRIYFSCWRLRQNFSCSSFSSLRVLLSRHVHRLLESSKSSCIDRPRLTAHRFFLCLQRSSYRPC